MVRLMIGLVMLGILWVTPVYGNAQAEAETAIKAAYADIHERFLAGDMGDVAYERGIGHLSNKQGEKLAAEDYMVIWKREDGQWKIYRDIVRGTPPPAK